MRSAQALLYATSDEPPGNRKLGIRVGVVAQRDQLTPQRQFWHRSALPWLPDLPGDIAERE